MAIPEEVDVPSRVAKPTPYAVCYGCNGLVLADAHEVSKGLVNETWHSDCYEGDDDSEEDNDVTTAQVDEK